MLLEFPGSVLCILIWYSERSLSFVIIFPPFQFQDLATTQLQYYCIHSTYFIKYSSRCIGFSLGFSTRNWGTETKTDDSKRRERNVKLLIINRIRERVNNYKLFPQTKTKKISKLFSFKIGSEWRVLTAPTTRVHKY